MTCKTPSAWLMSLLAMVFLVGVAAAPVSAHERGAAPAAAHAAPATAPEDMPVTDMAWPTEGGGGMAMDHARPKTFQGRLLAWIGMWHPAAVHFPIALLLTAALLEIAAGIRRRPVYAAGNKLLLAVAAAGAFVAAPLGWANAGLPASDDETALIVHRWLGTALPFLLLALWYLKRPVEQVATRPVFRLYEALFVLAVGLILVQAYFGAEVTHGADHMRF